MDKEIQNKDLQIEVTADEIKNLEQDLKNIRTSVDTQVNRRLKQSLLLLKTKNRTDKQQKELNELLDPMIYAFMLDNGTLLTSIPREQEKQYGLFAIRNRLIAEHNCQSAAELILVDEIAAAYWRLMQYESYASRTPEKENGGWSVTQLSVNFLKESRKQIEQAHRQIDVSLSMLKNLKQPQLKVNVKTENAYFAQNQQVINEKPADEPPVETIKPK